MSKQIMVAAHQWFYVERGFIYTPDINLGKHGTWRILQNKTGPFKGDCEDAALTIMDRMVQKGVAESDLFIVRCATENCPKEVPFNHAILGYRDGGEWWFSDNRRISTPAAHQTTIKDYKLYDAVSIDNLRGIGKPELFIK
jgi:predicted transglutaminase-like cysteine proteinase